MSISSIISFFHTMPAFIHNLKLIFYYYYFFAWRNWRVGQDL